MSTLLGVLREWTVGGDSSWQSKWSECRLLHEKLADSANADCMYHYIDLIIIIWSVLDFSWKGCEDISFYVCLPV